METLIIQASWETIQLAALFFFLGMLFVALPTKLSGGLPLRKAHRQFLKDCRLNMLDAEALAGLPCDHDAGPSQSVAPSVRQDAAMLRHAYAQAMQVYDDLKERGLSVKHLGYGIGEYHSLIDRLKCHCAHAGVLGLKPSTRPSFIPKADPESGIVRLIYVPDEVVPLDGEPEFAPRISLGPPPVPKIAEMTADDEMRLAEQLEREFVPRGAAVPPTIVEDDDAELDEMFAQTFSDVPTAAES